MTFWFPSLSRFLPNALWSTQLTFLACAFCFPFPTTWCYSRACRLMHVQMWTESIKKQKKIFRWWPLWANSLPLRDRYLKLGSQKPSPGQNLRECRLKRPCETASRGIALLVFFFFCACVVSLELRFLPWYWWGKYPTKYTTLYMAFVLVSLFSIFMRL